jgi:hypothetical protein
MSVVAQIKSATAKAIIRTYSAVIILLKAFLISLYKLLFGLAFFLHLLMKLLLESINHRKRKL